MVLLLPSVPLFVLSVLVWVLAPLWWHPIMLVLGVALVATALFVSLRTIVRNEQLVRDSSRPLNNYRWLPHWDATQFLRHFELFLRVRGWRIIDASAPQPDRILVVADKTKSKSRIVLLGVRPGNASAVADLDQLETVRASQLANRAALIVDPKPPEQDVHVALERGIITLRFTDLATLEEALHVVE